MLVLLSQFYLRCGRFEERLKWCCFICIMYLCFSADLGVSPPRLGPLYCDESDFSDLIDVIV